MKKVRTKIYVKASPENNEVVFSGIEFAEFINYLPQPMENLMLITGGSSIVLAETNLERGLELFEGHNLIGKLTKQNIYNLGNFCFVDYASASNTNNLSEEQIAELLYLGHMFKPLKSPFFEPLQNRFAYLAHDDGWYCKLYCRNLSEFVPVLLGKLASHEKLPKPNCSNVINEHLLQLTISGIFIDLEEINFGKGSADIKIYTVGNFSSIDDILNNLQHIKNNALQINNLHCSKEEWTIS